LYCGFKCDTAISTLALKPGMAQYCNSDDVAPGYTGGLSAFNTYIAGKLAAFPDRPKSQFHGFCQPCAGACSPERMYENWECLREPSACGVPNAAGGFASMLQLKSCVMVCGQTCPRCLMDQLCITESIGPTTPAPFITSPSLREQSYTPSDPANGFFTDSRGDVSMLYLVPPTSYNEYQDERQTDTSLPAVPVRYGLSPHLTSAGPYPKSGCWFDPDLQTAGVDINTLQAEYLACLKDVEVTSGRKDPSMCN